MEGETERVYGGREREYAEGDRESTWREFMEREIEGEYTRGGERERVRIWRERQSENMEDCLYDAAFRGDLVSLQAIIAKDKCILDKVLVGGYKGKNPLHVAIAMGQEDIVRELLRIKPELAEVLDAELGAALHVACSKGNLEIVKLLVGVSPEMCLARDREGNNPLHIAAMKGNVDVLETLLQTKPCAARVTTDRGDTILHLCVNYNQLESLKLLIRMVRGQEFFDSIDASGNNILHLAVFCNQYEIIEHVLLNPKIDVNARNGSGWTALEIHSHVATSKDPNSEDHRIEAVLTTAGAKRCSQLLIPFDPSWQKKRKSTLMIVSSLMATMAFQVGVNPPGGVWPDSKEGHIAGTAIIGYSYPLAYPFLMFVNTIGFLLCFTTIFELILVLPADKQDSGFARSGFLRFWFSWLTIMTVVFVYTYSVTIVAPAPDGFYVNNFVFTNAIYLTVMVWGILVSSMGRAPFTVRLVAGGVIALLVALLASSESYYFYIAVSSVTLQFLPFRVLDVVVSLVVAGVVLLMIHKRRSRNNSIQTTAASPASAAPSPIPNAADENDSSVTQSRLIREVEVATISDPQILIQN